MSGYVIIRQSRTPAEVFHAVRQVLQHGNKWHPSEGLILEWVTEPVTGDASTAFERAAEFLSDVSIRNRETVALVDIVDVSALNPTRGTGWSSMIASLVLAFPEVRWVFLVVVGRSSVNGGLSADTDSGIWEAIFELHGSQTILEDRGTPLFDGYGLRQLIRDRIVSDENRIAAVRKSSSHPLNIPSRPKLAVALDEELDFSLFEAHMAYSRGFRVHSPATWSETVALLGPSGLLTQGRSPSHNPNVLKFEWSERIQKRICEDFMLSLEDWYLSFPDQDVRGLSDMQERCRVLPALSEQTPRFRRFLTVGHERVRSVTSRRERQLHDLRSSAKAATGVRLRRGNQVIWKPASGQYTLWRALGLHRAFTTSNQRRSQRGLAPGYLWPPDGAAEAAESQDDPDNSGHSAPGRLLQIARHLTGRAAARLGTINTLPDAVLGAVLSTQALELLACKTPNLSADALALKHEFEVIAECHFLGVEYHLSTRERLQSIRGDLKVMSEWLHSARRINFVLNREAQILSSLTRVLDRYGKVEESADCRRRLRWLHRRISFRMAWADRDILTLFSFPGLLYADWVLRSPRHYLLTLLSVIVIFSFGFAAFGQQHPLHDAVNCVITVSVLPMDGQSNNLAVWLSYLAAVAGVLNLGLLVSQLYSRMSRQIG